MQSDITIISQLDTLMPQRHEELCHRAGESRKALCVWGGVSLIEDTNMRIYISCLLQA